MALPQSRIGLNRYRSSRSARAPRGHPTEGGVQVALGELVLVLVDGEHGDVVDGESGKNTKRNGSLPTFTRNSHRSVPLSFLTSRGMASPVASVA